MTWVVVRVSAQMFYFFILIVNTAYWPHTCKMFAGLAYFLSRINRSYASSWIVTSKHVFSTQQVPLPYFWSSWMVYCLLASPSKSHLCCYRHFPCNRLILIFYIFSRSLPSSGPINISLVGIIPHVYLPFSYLRVLKCSFLNTIMQLIFFSRSC